MEKLPEEIIVRILSRLPVTSLVQLMLVCRRWRSLIQDPILVSNHFSNMANYKGPSFIFQSNHPSSSYQLFFIDFSDMINHCEGEKVMLKKLPDFYVYTSYVYLVDSCNGLLCIRDLRGIHIFNPFTRVYLQLPKLIYYPAEVGHIAIGFHPTTKKYNVIRILYRRQLSRSDAAAYTSLQYSLVHVVTIGTDPGWRHIATLPYELTWPTPKALVNGRLHWLSKPNQNSTASLLISFDLETEQFQEVPKPECCFHHVLVLRGCLAAVAYNDNEEMEIWVMKGYGVKESWTKEFIIEFYLPPMLQQHDLLLHFNNARARFPNSAIRPLCILKNGDVLLEYKNRVLVLYDPQHGTFKELTFPEMQHWYQTVVHVGSLNWIDTPVINF